MKQVLIRQGAVVVEDVPAPPVGDGAVLVAARASCLSVGTEIGGLAAAAEPLWKRALKNPQKVRKVLRMVRQQGLARTRDAVAGRLAAAQPTGYSSAGVVMEVGAGVEDIRVGERVACAGAQCAHHAEVICVPRNLLVPVPEGVDFPAASTVALGAIALQGVRRAGVQIGESFAVIGLGALGQLTVQLLKACGCRALGADLDEGRMAVAMQAGMDAALRPAEGDTVQQVFHLTGGLGADGVIVTASSPSDEVISTAFRMCRRKGRVVLVGDVGLKLNRQDLYAKELDFFISTSYGPGRYDASYEEDGLDYPPAYVRWTENRNMAEYLRLVGEGKVRLGVLPSATFPVERAAAAYEAAGSRRPLLVMLSYGAGEADAAARQVPNPLAAAAADGRRIRIAVVGAGQFAMAVHLPNLLALREDFALRAVADRVGHGAADAARRFGAEYSASDYRKVLEDADVDAVLIATRHHLHAAMALEALRAGKHVLVEKPLALTEAELSAIEEFYASAAADRAPILLTGFNRRFSRLARRLAELTAGRSGPMILNYRMNAGYLPSEHWVHGPEGGGRNLGEACHIYDLFTYLTAAAAGAVDGRCIEPARGGRQAAFRCDDNFVATVCFDDGSLATLTYTALGCAEHPKEQMDVYWDGKVATLTDYRSLTVAGAPGRGLAGKTIDKGHKDELAAFARAIRQGGDWPIPLSQQLQAMRIALRVQRHLTGGADPVPRPVPPG